MIKRILCYAFFCLLLFTQSGFAQPSGFVDERVSTGWTLPVGLTFDTQGRMYVWEKGGKVFMVENGVKNKEAIIDISEEVLNFNDHGLNGLALDPDFLNNGYIYLLYTVRRHYALFYGTTEYDSTNADDFKTTIGRITRYTLNKSDGFKTLDSTSRKVLLGESISTGIPILVDNHGVGSLVFGNDGTLLISTGDAAFASEPPGDDTKNAWFLEAIEIGIISPDQNVSAYRSQLLNSLNGKLLRIDPATGDGVTSNPFFEMDAPRSARSRVWAYGLRNSFRFTVQPDTGSESPADGKPGVIFAGDVGWNHREEINSISHGGQNFGWPTYEGLSYVNESYADTAFKPDSAVKPIIEWRGPLAQAMVDGDAYGVGSDQFKGLPFSGSASIGGVFYTLSAFPETYQNLYFQGDYDAEGWVKAFRFDEKNNPVEVIDFVNGVSPTCFSLNPVDGYLYYVNYLYPDKAEIRRISFDPNANLRPVLVAEATPIYGKSPLNVNFKASDSKDPENGPLTFFWDFGDGKSSNLANPTHTYVAGSAQPQVFKAILNVTDNAGKSDTKTFNVYLNNTPPSIIHTSIDKVNWFLNTADFPVNLSATVSDLEHTDLSYEWSVVLHHDEHTHFVTSFRKTEGQIVLGQVPCDSQTYFYRVSLTVTDSLGLSMTYSKDITPVCENDTYPDSEEIILSVYPNPTKNVINLLANSDFDNHFIKLKLLRSTGQLISEREGYWKDMKDRISKDLSDQSEGIYFLNILYGDKNKAFRIYKE